jgi:16S rRNA (guanine966-N2)-methyltransferase
MRIISGSLKGRRLVGFTGSHIRPTTDRVKETLFNILQSDWEGARVLDLFAGTGNLGFESWSRGATMVDAVEAHKISQKIIDQNRAALKIDVRYALHRMDVFLFLKKYRGEAFDIILADPPFTEVIAHDVMVAISTSLVRKRDTVIAIESARRERLEDSYEPLVRIDSRAFGDKILSLFKERPSVDTDEGSLSR